MQTIQKNFTLKNMRVGNKLKKKHLCPSQGNQKYVYILRTRKFKRKKNIFWVSIHLTQKFSFSFSVRSNNDNEIFCFQDLFFCRKKRFQTQYQSSSITFKIYTFIPEGMFFYNIPLKRNIIRTSLERIEEYLQKTVATPTISKRKELQLIKSCLRYSKRTKMTQMKSKKRTFLLHSSHNFNVTQKKRKDHNSEHPLLT